MGTDFKPAPQIDPSSFSPNVTNPLLPFTPGTTLVYAGTKDGKTAAIPVQIGAADAIHTQITSGLKQGDRVALAQLNRAIPSSSGTLTNRGGFAGVGGSGLNGGTGTGFGRSARG